MVASLCKLFVYNAFFHQYSLTKEVYCGKIIMYYFEIALHNEYYVVNTSGVRVFVSAGGVFRRFPSCKYAWCLRSNVRGYQRALQYLSVMSSMCEQIDGADYAETL